MQVPNPQNVYSDVGSRANCEERILETFSVQKGAFIISKRGGDVQGVLDHKSLQISTCKMTFTIFL